MLHYVIANRPTNAMGSKHYKNCILFKNHRGLQIKTNALVGQK